MKKLFLILCCLFPLVLFSIDEEVERTPLTVPLVDVPFNFAGRGYSFPSMQQSLNLSKDFYQLGHYAIEEALSGKKRWIRILTEIGFDVFSTWLPLGNGWMHEEWHRAVLSRRNFASYNDFYNFPIFSNIIAVSHVQDADLIALKRDHPAEQVRLQSAGMEAEWEQNFRFEKEKFFDRDPTDHLGIIILNDIGSSFYLFHCAGSSSDETTNIQNSQDGSNIPKRDFTGLDCNGWVYDLFRPDEPYAARGIHPSGVGINRYRKWSDLNGDEQNFLKLTAGLSLLNFLDPNLARFNRFHGTSPFSGDPLEWSTMVRALPTSFGVAVDGNLFWKEGVTNLILILHSYLSPKQYFPGLEVELYRYPLTLFGENENITLRGMAWLQPKKQRFDSKAGTLGGLAGLRFGHAFSKTFEAFLEVEGKSEGWVAGNVYLDSNLSTRAGLITYLY